MVEEAFDLSVRRDQQLSELLDRAVTIPPSSDPAGLNGLVSDILHLKDSADNIDIAVAAKDEAIEARNAAAAKSLTLPHVTTNSMIVDNAAGTLRETKTFPQVRALLEVRRSMICSTLTRRSTRLQETAPIIDGCPKRVATFPTKVTSVGHS